LLQKLESKNVVFLCKEQYAMPVWALQAIFNPAPAVHAGAADIQRFAEIHSRSLRSEMP